MSTARAISVAVVFVWLGMVLAISFVETPLKFRAPGVTLQIGLGIGRLVFRALNVCELVLAVTVLAVLDCEPPTAAVGITAVVAVVALVVQVVVVRPALSRRTDATLAGAGGSRSRTHWVYVALEIVKVFALLSTGVALLAT